MGFSESNKARLPASSSVMALLRVPSEAPWECWAGRRPVEHRIIFPFVLQEVSSECRLGTAKDNPSASVMLLPFYIAEL